MSDDMISQEEIDALLNGGSIPTADSAPAGESETAAATVVHLSLMMCSRIWKRML